jgi:hypothetical protein
MGHPAEENASFCLAYADQFVVQHISGRTFVRIAITSLSLSIPPMRYQTDNTSELARNSLLSEVSDLNQCIDLMNLWGRLGISVAFAAMFGIVMTEALQTTTYYGRFKWYLCIGFFISGVVLYIIGYFLNNNWRAKQLAKRNIEGSDGREQEEGGGPEDPFLLVNLAYWGVMMVVFAAITAFIVPRPKEVKAAEVPVPARTNRPASKVLPTVVATNEPPAVRPFP